MSPRQVAAGLRNRQVTIQQLMESKGPSGFPVEKWTSLVTVMASKDDQEGQERFNANQLSSPFDTTWQIPYIAGIDPELLNVPKKRRLVYQNRVYDIVSASPIGELHRGIKVRTLAGGLLT
jgi:SPP1 family predicted phage head-tail adaptor